MNSSNKSDLKSPKFSLVEKFSDKPPVYYKILLLSGISSVLFNVAPGSDVLHQLYMVEMTVKVS